MTARGRDPYEDRLARFRKRLEKAHCDSALLTNLTSIRYLTGFTGTAGLFAVTPERAHLIVDFRYTEQAESQCSCPVTKREGGLEQGLGKWLEGGRRCAVESQNVTLDLMDRLRTASGKAQSEREWVPCLDLVEKLRVVKDAAEIERLAASCALLEELMQRVLESLRPGMRELDAALAFESAARKATGRPLPFEPIIASGPRGALPHGIASEKPIARGELVVVDIGLELDGYVADMTRTVAVGSADDRMREVHEAVHLANRTAAQGIRAGMTGAEAHALAHGVLEARNLGERFGHGLGHGIGLEIHEDPRLSPLGEDRLEENMVFTIEPGAYIPGWGGVRIEDAGVLCADGVEVFNKMERGLLVV